MQHTHKSHTQHTHAYVIAIIFTYILSKKRCEEPLRYISANKSSLIARRTSRTTNVFFLRELLHAAIYKVFTPVQYIIM